MLYFCVSSSSCNSMPCSGCSACLAWYGVNPNFLKKNSSKPWHALKDLFRASEHIWNYATRTLISPKEPSAMLNQPEWSNSTAGKCAIVKTVHSQKASEPQQTRKEFILTKNVELLTTSFVWAKLKDKFIKICCFTKYYT